MVKKKTQEKLKVGVPTKYGRKRGKLSNAEMKYIRENFMDLSIEEIAGVLSRTTEPIQKYIDKENLRARDLDDASHLLYLLRDRYYYGELKNQMSDTEIIFFEHQWVDFFKQFNEDVAPTEESQILEVIRTEILINRSMRDRQEVSIRVAQLEQLVDTEMSKDVEEQDMASISLFQVQIGSLIGSKSAYINEHEKLLTKKEKYLKDLKGTREQRKRIADDAKTNFILWLRELDDKEKKEEEGFDMEVQRVAAEKARARLSELHEYGDGEVDQPLLNSDTYIPVEGE